MQLKSNIGKKIDESPYKRQDIKEHFKKSRNTISNWCTGNSYPTVPELFELAHLLNSTVDDLYEVIKEGENMDKTIYKIDQLKSMEELDFNKKEALLVNGVSLFDIDSIHVETVSHDLVSIKFLKNDQEIASLLINDENTLEVYGNGLRIVNKERN